MDNTQQPSDSQDKNDQNAQAAPAVLPVDERCTATCGELLETPCPCDTCGRLHRFLHRCVENGNTWAGICHECWARPAGSIRPPELYEPTRPVMSGAELAAHRVRRHGRNYAVSCDGYDDMAEARKQGWTPIGGWGEDGWDLGDWPYVAIYRRTQGGKHELMQVVEGDHDLYAFPSRADLEAAIDYLFLWYSAGESWAPVPISGRDSIGSPGFTVDAKFRGPFSWERSSAGGRGRSS